MSSEVQSAVGSKVRSPVVLVSSSSSALSRHVDTHPAAPTRGEGVAPPPGGVHTPKGRRTDAGATFGSQHKIGSARSGFLWLF